MHLTTLTYIKHKHAHWYIVMPITWHAASCMPQKRVSVKPGLWTGLMDRIVDWDLDSILDWCAV